MTIKIHFILCSILGLSLVACTGESSKTPSPIKDTPKNTTKTNFQTNSPKIEQFFVNYLPPKEITDKIGEDAQLTFSLKLKTDSFAGDYTFFDCLDSECETSRIMFVIKCNKERSCQGFDSLDIKVGTPDYIWTLAYLWHPVYNSRTKEYDTWTGLDLQFVDPASLKDGFHDQFYASQFEDLMGNKSDLKVFHFKK